MSGDTPPLTPAQSAERAAALMAIDTSLTIEMDLAVALAAIKRGRNIIEDNADADDSTKDAAALRAVYDQLITAMHGVASALGQVRHRDELRAAIEMAATEPAPPRVPPAVRLVLVK